MEKKGEPKVKFEPLEDTVVPDIHKIVHDDGGIEVDHKHQEFKSLQLKKSRCSYFLENDTVQQLNLYCTSFDNSFEAAYRQALRCKTNRTVQQGVTLQSNLTVELPIPQ